MADRASRACIFVSVQLKVFIDVLDRISSDKRENKERISIWILLMYWH